MHIAQEIRDWNHELYCEVRTDVKQLKIINCLAIGDIGKEKKRDLLWTHTTEATTFNVPFRTLSDIQRQVAGENPRG